MHNASNLLAAVAVASRLGLSPDEIRRGLEGFQPVPGRSELRRIRGGPLVLCDYYNANPASMAAAFELLATLPVSGVRWACLGDMLELGSEEEHLHRELASPLMRAGVSAVLLAGPRMAALADELHRRGFPGRVARYERVEDLGAALKRDARPEDAVLVKGSRGMRMERAVPAAEPGAEREP
jgi:UDP-N-acetylmuramoyl-tripeptide--D-alanyl-D-alanine ligase